MCNVQFSMYNDAPQQLKIGHWSLYIEHFKKLIHFKIY